MRALHFFLIAAGLAFTGCAGYHLGPVNGVTAGEKSVQVLPFNNQTLQPRLGDDVTEAVRERVQSDATYRLATSGTGDIVVTGVIRQYQHQGLGYLNHDSATPQNYRIGITAHVTARESATGKILFDRDVKGLALVNIGPDLLSSERQANPTLAADLANNIIGLLAEGAW
jgi:Lipopolysaccharide-assembly